MVINQLLSLIFCHVVQGVVISRKVISESFQSRGDLTLDLKSLLVCDPWAERELSQVSSSPDSCTDDHFSIFLVKRLSFETRGIHLQFFYMVFYAMVRLYDLIEEVFKRVVSVMAGGINTYS
jgi:hypothetical protein